MCMPEQAAAPAKVRLQRFWRPEDVGREAGYRAGFWDVYACAQGEAAEVPVEDVVRKCTVLPAGCAGGARTHTLHAAMHINQSAADLLMLESPHIGCR